MGNHKFSVQIQKKNKKTVFPKEFKRTAEENGLKFEIYEVVVIIVTYQFVASLHSVVPIVGKIDSVRY
jgi:hypothetical protein